MGRDFTFNHHQIFSLRDTVVSSWDAGKPLSKIYLSYPQHILSSIYQRQRITIIDHNTLLNGIIYWAPVYLWYALILKDRIEHRDCLWLPSFPSRADKHEGTYNLHILPCQDQALCSVITEEVLWPASLFWANLWKKPQIPYS